MALQSLAAAPTVIAPLRRGEEPQRRGRAHRQSPTANSRRPLVAQPTTPSPAGARRDPRARSVTPPGRAQAAGIPKSRSKPLLDDVSLYTNPHLTRDNESTSLEELAHVVRLSKYQERKRANTRIRLHRSLVSTALSARLTRCGEIAHRNLVDNFRKDDKDSFALLYNAIHDVRKSCDELRRYALLEPEMEAPSSPALASSDSVDTPTNSVVGVGPLRSIAPFLHDISASARDTFLDFLSQLRTNPDYLATRICALTSSELNAFLSFHKGLEPVESVLPFHGRSATRSHSGTPARNSHNADIERLLSFQRHDPLSILIHTCFANSAGPDSSEDQRRTEIWSTVLARLIQQPKSSSEHFLISVLNIWTAMRDWSGKSSMEWYLMKILEDGAFLLDRAEDQHGTRFNLSDWNQSDELAAKAFYDKAVDDLFELVDDEDATGIPEGLLELGNAIITKLDNKYVENTSKWFVWRCLFFVFLLGVIVHPESYGMLAEYHITPYAREKILKKVAMKAHEYVSSMWSGKPSATCVPVQVPPKIKAHVEGILARFQGARSKVPAAKLLPARSITSLRETVEVHPYLVISPADLLTLVNALFPEKRPLSAGSSMRSGQASISGLSAISQPIPMANSRGNFETASIISTSVSSALSDGAASREGLSDDPNTATPQRYSPPTVDPEAQRRLNKYEDDGYRLRLALHELSQNLGPENLRGVCHPCAERWAVLFVSSDGRALSMNMTYDPDDERDEEDNSSSVDTDDEDGDSGPELDKDYHQLRDSILRLVEDYEIPRSLEPDSERTQLSNRASRLKRYKSKTKIITPESTMSSRNPYRNHVAKESTLGASEAVVDDPDPILITMLKAASARSKAQADFVSAHAYWKTLKQLNALGSSSLRENGFAVLVNIFSRGPKDSIRRSASAIEEYDAWLVWLKQSQERHEGLIEQMMRRVRAMRDKMWFVTDVRNSREYAHSRDVCQALKTMGMPRRWNSFQRSRPTTGRGHNASFLYRTESQVMDLLAASEDQGGPNKLSDDQAEKTALWLQQYNVENFCQGEERIHRFCCEVDRCISQLIGETIREAPVLWSSDLYKRDKLVYDRMRIREREQATAGDDNSSILSDTDRRFPSPVTRASAYTRDARGIGSQHYVDSARARTGAQLSDIVDGQEYFEKASPIHTIDSASTFWSPFQPTMSPGSLSSRAYSPTTSLTNLSTTFSGPLYHSQLPSSSSVSFGRPATSASSNETVFPLRAEDEKSRFLNELRQSVTSLLLSDLGTLVLARGSETDVWFQNLGQQCIERKEALDRRARRRSERREKDRQSKSSPRPRVIEKKKSCNNLRGVGDGTGERPSGSSDMAPKAEHEGQALGGGDGNSRPSTKETAHDFPFKKAYQRLLNMFSVHPNPYAKLNALNELEHLIVASLLSTGSKRARASRSDAGSSVVEDGGGINRPAQLEGTIDNVRERRSQALQSALPSTGLVYQSRQSNSETRSILSGSATNTDAITKELQVLFRDPSIRPKSLFRDLQMIASFVPPSILDKSERGKAFWNTGLAALKVKSEVCRTMVEMADEIVAARAHSRKSPEGITVVTEAVPSTTGTPPPPSSTYKLDDAGKMWAITAKEGYPTAQRELALFYLSNPEFVERTTVPLSKPREVFKQVVMEKYGRSERARGSVGALNAGVMGGSGGGMRPQGASAGSADGPPIGATEGDVRNDAGIMCVAVHWMEAAEQGGDELASSFLRQNEFAGLP
ncbi:ABC transporter ABCl1 [Purpureocillium lavendulum]|uniref:ABC transporter ABCl1 n=1 Tax=Purpureocillium lavendulum TaxID=1247861 RepID=A0AB34FG70_9HYPO|nr:ABC transporter ABCl1 [Purpureocillium lavendulum]